jgi:cell division protein FtsB
MTKTNLTAAIDQLGDLQAQIAELTTRAKAIKDEIKELGDGAYEGELFRVTVSTSERETLDMAAVREKLSPQFIRAHTNVTPVVTVRCVSRNGKKTV